jgi:hypothetical protein
VIADENYRPRLCIYAHPPPGDSRVIRFSRVPLGERIRGHAMHHWMHERERTGRPVRLTLRVDGEALGTVVHHDGEGWAAFEFATEHRMGSLGDVEFVVEAEGEGPRPFCFEAVSE